MLTGPRGPMGKEPGTDPAAELLDPVVQRGVNECKLDYGQLFFIEVIWEMKSNGDNLDKG